VIKKESWIEKRIYLNDVVPLRTPLCIKIDPTRSCNFKCIYCGHSTSDPSIKDGGTMTLETFEKFIAGFTFPEKARSITFAGLGEPLLNKKLPEMIRLSKKIADETILVTNGSLLTESMADKLIDAGLDTVRISLQGLNAFDYKRIGGVEIDFDRFLEQLIYFYNNKKDTEIWVKMPDIALNTKEKRNMFETLFSDKSDHRMIQTIGPLFSCVDYSKMGLNKDNTVFQELPLNDVCVCPTSFYLIYLIPDGSVFPCFEIQFRDLIMGNINDDSIYNIWNGRKMTDFRYEHLKKTWKNINICNECTSPMYFNNSYDNIDNSRERLLDVYKNTNSNKRGSHE
jgi:radical SAM protein with 4Fe4S-binding SPASM domain